MTVLRGSCTEEAEPRRRKLRRIEVQVRTAENRIRVTPGDQVGTQTFVVADPIVLGGSAVEDRQRGAVRDRQNPVDLPSLRQRPGQPGEIRTPRRRVAEIRREVVSDVEGGQTAPQVGVVGINPPLPLRKAFPGARHAGPLVDRLRERVRHLHLQAVAEALLDPQREPVILGISVGVPGCAPHRAPC